MRKTIILTEQQLRYIIEKKSISFSIQKYADDIVDLFKEKIKNKEYTTFATKRNNIDITILDCNIYIDNNELYDVTINIRIWLCDNEEHYIETFKTLAPDSEFIKLKGNEPRSLCKIIGYAINNIINYEYVKTTLLHELTHCFQYNKQFNKRLKINKTSTLYRQALDVFEHPEKYTNYDCGLARCIYVLNHQEIDANIQELYELLQNNEKYEDTYIKKLYDGIKKDLDFFNKYLPPKEYFKVPEFANLNLPSFIESLNKGFKYYKRKLKHIFEMLNNEYTITPK